jgi:hypothetical protein
MNNYDTLVKTLEENILYANKMIKKKKQLMFWKGFKAAHVQTILLIALDKELLTLWTKRPEANLSEVLAERRTKHD